MDRQSLIVNLQATAREISDKEHALMVAGLALQASKEVLQQAEDQLILAGEIDGKNAEIRAAQLRERTAEERARVQEAERAYEVAKLDLSDARTRYATLQTIARLIAGEREVA